MKQQEVFKKIRVIIQEINEQYVYLESTGEQLNDLELELFVANTHFLKDHAEILRKLNAIKSQPVTQTSIKDEPKWFEPVVHPAKPAAAPFKPEPIQTLNSDPIRLEIVQQEEVAPEDQPAEILDLTESTPGDNYAYEREEPEVVRLEIILDEGGILDEEEENQSQDEILLTPIAEIAEPEQAEEPEEELAAAEEVDEPQEYAVVVAAEPMEEVVVAEPVTLEDEHAEPVQTADKKPVAESMEDIQVANLRPTVAAEKAEQPAFVAEEDDKVLTLNQRLSAQRKEQHTRTAQVVEPLADIKSAINLNDKLLFVKDLFKGYNLAYTEAIEIVNRFSSFEEADRFLKNNYVSKNNWEAKKETSDKFYALLRRRYA